MIYRWICPGCNGAYILPRRTKHQYNHWRCYSCNKVFHEPFEVMSMGMDSMFEDPLHEVKRPANGTEIVSNYDGPYKFHADMMMYSETPSGHAKIGQSTKRSSALKKEKRRRATIVAEQDGKFLLVTERGASRYSLPGGGIEHGEFTLEAASRELREETGLWMVQAEHLFDHEGQVTLHKVVWARVKGKVKLQRKELRDFVWWGCKEDLPILESAKAILEKAMDAKAIPV